MVGTDYRDSQVVNVLRVSDGCVLSLQCDILSPLQDSETSQENRVERMYQPEEEGECRGMMSSRQNMAMALFSSTALSTYTEPLGIQ